MKKLNLRYLILAIAIGILGAVTTVSGVVKAAQVIHTTSKSDDLYTDNVEKLEYWNYTDKVTSTDFAVVELGEKELIIELLDFDGKPKAKSSSNSNKFSLVESSEHYYILEDEDTGIQYMISSGLTTYRVRTLETGMPYCNKSI